VFGSQLPIEMLTTVVLPQTITIYPLLLFTHVSSPGTITLFLRLILSHSWVFKIFKYTESAFVISLFWHMLLLLLSCSFLRFDLFSFVLLLHKNSLYIFGLNWLISFFILLSYIPLIKHSAISKFSNLNAKFSSDNALFSLSNNQIFADISWTSFYQICLESLRSASLLSKRFRILEIWPSNISSHFFVSTEGSSVYVLKECQPEHEKAAIFLDTLNSFFRPTLARARNAG